MGIKRRIGISAKSSPKFFSTEFLLQNHADIVGTIIVLITVGLIFEPTSKYATKFVALQYNTTDRKCPPNIFPVDVRRKRRLPL